MRLSRAQLIWGLALILLGALMLAVNLGYLPATVSFFAWVFGGAGLLFLLSFLTDRSAWGLLIPACVCLGLGATVFLADSGVPGGVVGAVFMGSIALPFWVIWLMRRREWWPIIPAGVLSVLAIVSLFAETRLAGEVVGAIFFLGLAATFALVRLVTLPDRHMSWAWYPAVILGVMGLIVLAIGQPILWSLVLIGGGVLLLLRSVLPRRS